MIKSSKQEPSGMHPIGWLLHICHVPQMEGVMNEEKHGRGKKGTEPTNQTDCNSMTSLPGNWVQCQVVLSWLAGSHVAVAELCPKKEQEERAGEMGLTPELGAFLKDKNGTEWLLNVCYDWNSR